MAHTTKKDQMRYIEVGSFFVDYNEGDAVIFDSVKDISPLYPIKQETTLIAVAYRGRQKVAADGQVIDFEKGMALICPPNVKVTGAERSDDFECTVICIADNLIHSLLRDKIDIWHQRVYVNQLNVVQVPEEACQEELRFYFTIIQSKLKRNNPSTPCEILTALLRAFLLEFCFMMQSEEDGVQHDQKLSQGKVLFNRFLSLISGSQVKRQSINSYASQLAITPKYLTMLCLKYSNKTASEWVAQYTVEEIRFYLKSTDLSIKEITARLGFSNMSHFGSYVRKYLGASPSEYRYSKKKGAKGKG